MGNISHTVGGDSNLVSFRSAARVPITSLKASFLPKQDLHGYTKPWIGGNGKNKLGFTLGMNLPNSSNRTIDFTNDYITINVQDAVTTNAIIDYNNMVSYCKTNLIPGTYTFSIQDFDTNISNISKSDIKIIFTHNIVVSDGETFTISENCTGLAVNYSSMINWNNGDYMQFHLQIEEGSSVTTWEPYENICPIEGWNSLTTYQSSINIWDEQWEIGSIRNSDGKDVVSSNAIRSKNYIRVFPQYKYYCYINHDSQTIKIVYYDQNKEYAGNYLWRGGNILTIPNNVHYIRFATRDIYGETYCNDISINYPHTDTSYHPYLGQTIPITFPTLGKNKFNWNVVQGHASPTSSDAQTARIYPLNTYIIGLSSSNYYRDNYTNWVLEPSITNGTISFSSGNASGYGIGFPLDLIPGQTYFLSGTVDNNGGAAALYYDEQGALLSSQTSKLNKTITIPNNTKTTVIVFYSTATQTSYNFSNIQLELGTEATTYEEYNPNNTVYGGYVDIAKREVVQTWKIVDLGDYSWSYASSGNPPYFGYRFEDRKIGAFNLYCSSLPLINKTGTPNLKDCSIVGSTINGFVFVRYDAYTSALDFMAAVAGIKLAYELETPIHYPLTKTQLQTLLDQNNIWTNTNSNTEVSYAIHDSAMIRSSKKQIIGNEPYIATTSGNIATFNTDMIAPIKSAKVYFNPVQEGSGEPSPNNIRNITGWTSVETSYMRKNLFDISFFENAEGVTVDGNTFSGYVSPIHQVTYKKLMPMKIPKGSIFTTKAITYRSVSDTGAGWSFWFVYANGERVRPFYTYNSTITPTEYKGTLTAADDIIGLDLGYYNQASTGIWYISDVQIEINSSDTTYEEYNNSVIPITFPATKNLFDEKYEGIISQLTYHSLYVGDGDVTASTTTPRSTNEGYSNIFVFPGQVTSGAGTGINDVYDGHPRTITPVDGYITIAYRNGYDVDPTQYHTQIEKGNVATFYEPYGTVYGGYINLLVGKLVATHYYYEFTSASNRYEDSKGYYWWTTASGMKIPSIHTDRFVICDRMKIATNLGTDVADGWFLFSSNGIIRWKEQGTLNKTEYNEYLQNNPFHICYQLATPIEYSLTPQQLTALKGVNNIWSNANGNIEIQYWKH